MFHNLRAAQSVVLFGSDTLLDVSTVADVLLQKVFYM